MRYLFAALSIVLFSAQANHAFGQPPAKEPKQFVGEVIIVGNTITQDRVIRAVLDDLPPGQPLVRGNLKKAEAKLIRLGIFKKFPTVTVIESDGNFKDILVKVEETNTRRLEWKAGADCMGRPVFRLLMHDRNFDPFRLPTSMADIEEGAVFRGGGDKVRIEILRVNVLDGTIRFFSEGLVIPALVRPQFEK